MQAHSTAAGRFMTAVRAFHADRSGVTALEYGLIAALVVSAIVGGLTQLGNNLWIITYFGSFYFG